jgi:hypothetical protein
MLSILTTEKVIHMPLIKPSGSGPYEFMLWAGDGDSDTFHMKMWNEDEDTVAEAVIYDNDKG